MKPIFSIISGITNIVVEAGKAIINQISGNRKSETNPRTDENELQQFEEMQSSAENTNETQDSATAENTTNETTNSTTTENTTTAPAVDSTNTTGTSSNESPETIEKKDDKGNIIIYKKGDDGKYVVDKDESIKRNLEAMGVKTDKDGKRYTEVVSWDGGKPPKEGMEANNCLSRIAANYKPDDMEIWNEALDVLMELNPKIYDSGRTTLIDDEKYNTVLYTGDKINLPDEWFEGLIGDIEKYADDNPEIEDPNAPDPGSGTNPNPPSNPGEIRANFDARATASSLHEAMSKQEQTDKETIEKYLGNKYGALTNAELREVMKEYEAKYGKTLADDINNDFTQSDQVKYLAKIKNAEEGLMDDYAGLDYDQRVQKIEDLANDLYKAMSGDGDADAMKVFQIMQLGSYFVEQIMSKYDSIAQDGVSLEDKVKEKFKGGYLTELNNYIFLAKMQRQQPQST